jgi:hypothetical protein
MSQYVANVYALKSVVDLCDQTVSIALKVEHRPSIHEIRTSKGLANIRQVPPRRPLDDPEPNIEWGFEITVTRRCFFEPLTANDVQAMPQEDFALRELHCSSHIANMSSNL